MKRVFDMPLTDAHNKPNGVLQVTYNEQGLLTADYLLHGRLPDRIPWTMLQSTLFAPVMEQIEAAIANNRESLLMDHNQNTLS